MLELQILHSFCEKKELFVNNSLYFEDILDNMERELKSIYFLIQEYYTKYTNTSNISKNELYTFYKYKYPVSRDETVIKELIHTMFETHSQNVLITDLLKQIKEKYFATKIVNKLLPVVEGNKYGVFPTLQSDIEQFTTTQSTIEREEINPCELSIQELVAEVIQRDGLQWHLNELTNILGPIPKKSLGAVFGYVNSAKTSFAISAVTRFAEQLKDTDEDIVYAGNEEAKERVMLRQIMALTGMTTTQIKNNPGKAEHIAKQKGKHIISTYDSINNIEKVEYLLEKHTPRVIVIDQGTKVSTKTQEKDVIRIQHLYNHYRDLATKYNTSMIAISQGDATTANKKWLNLDDIYSSKVGIPGELDYAIGIGFIADEISKKNIRYINIPKNKGPMGRFICNFNEETCVWKDI